MGAGKGVAAVLCIGVLAAGVGALPVEDYLSQRSGYVAEQQAMRFDGANRTLGPQEASANATLMALRSELRANISRVLATPLRAVKPLIEETRLFRILHEMPKGAVLHIHAPAMVDMEWFLVNATYRANCYVFWPNTTKLVKTRPGTTRFYTKGKEPEGYYAASELRARIPGFDALLLAKWDVMRNETFIDESTDPWGPFQSFFTMIGGAFNYEPVYRDCMVRAFVNAYDQWKVRYIELRGLGLSHEGVYTLEATYTSTEQGRILQDCIKVAKQLRPGFYGAAVIYEVIRHSTPEFVSTSLADAVEAQANLGSDFMLGFDLVGEEDRGMPLLSFVEQLVGAKGKIDYYFHAGETDWVGNGTTGDNVNDAVLLGSKRIGHGLAMAKLPLAMQKARDNGIAVEVNPVSNQALQYVLDVREHPASTLLDHGIPIVLSNDDPTILGTAGSLAYDYFLPFLGWDMDLASLRQLALNSITYSGAPQSLKADLLASFASDWDAWVASINKALI